MVNFLTIPYAVAKRIWERNPKRLRYWRFNLACNIAPLRFSSPFGVIETTEQVLRDMEGCTCTDIQDHYGERVRVTTLGCPVHDKP